MYRIVRCLCTAILLFQFPCVLVAQQHPDLSGTWVMDAERSESYATQGPVTLVINQASQVLTIEYNRDAETLIRQYRLDSSENIHEADIRSRAKFNKERLTITSYYPVKTDIGEWWVTSTVIYSPTETGNEMVTETTISMDHGYTFSDPNTPGKAMDVFVRQD